MLIENTEMPKYWEITQIDQIQVKYMLYISRNRGIDFILSQDYGDRNLKFKSIFVVKWV